MYRQVRKYYDIHQGKTLDDFAQKHRGGFGLTEHLFFEAARCVKKYKTRDPFVLLDYINAVTKFSYVYPADGQKGYCAVFNKIKYAVINGNLDEHYQLIAAGHEAAHLVLHYDHIIKMHMLRDFDLFGSAGRLERQANFFLADFLITDEHITDILSYDDIDYNSLASSLYIPNALLCFKLHSMRQRGYSVKLPEGLDSGFLGK